MTEWRTFDTPPDDGQSVIIAYKSSDGRTCFIHTYYSGEIGLPMLKWFSMPPLPDEASKPKFEVPRDGLTYLCWVKDRGMCLLRHTYQGMYKPAGGFKEDCLCLDEIEAYMDRNGKWVRRDA